MKKRAYLFLLVFVFWISLFPGTLAEPVTGVVLPELTIGSCFLARDTGTVTPQSFDDPSPTGELEIWFGRISCCDGFIIRCGGKTMLVDGGAKVSASATYALLDGLGITRVNYLFNTHHHDDHLQMQTVMVSKGRLTADVFPTPYERGYNIEGQRNAEAAMDAAGIEYRVLHDGDSMRLGGENGALLQFYRWLGNTNANYSSMICKITYGDRSAFLMADAISKGQQGLAERDDIDWKTDILKAGYHGYTLRKTVCWTGWIRKYVSSLTAVWADSKPANRWNASGSPAISRISVLSTSIRTEKSTGISTRINPIGNRSHRFCIPFLPLQPDQ